MSLVIHDRRWGACHLKEQGIAIITTTITASVYIEILDNFPIPLIENWFGDDEIIFPDDNASCCISKGIKVFFSRKDK